MAEDFTVRDLLSFLDDYAPFALAESWDNVGLMVGNPSATITGILVSLDTSQDILSEAKKNGCNTIINHHPLLFHPPKQIDTSTVQGRLVRQALVDDLHVIACHTNLDVVPGGVNEALADLIGMVAQQPLVARDCQQGDCGFGRLGRLEKGSSGREFVQQLSSLLEQPDILVAGELPERVELVAVCGGSCGEFGPQAQAAGAQLLVTSEIKHSQARWAEDAGFCLIDCGHYATENVVVPVLLEKIAAFGGGSVPVVASQRQQRPLRCFTE